MCGVEDRPRLRPLDAFPVEIQGRKDYQVKVRGFRIELGEIEAAITLHDYVRDCIVLVREDAGGEKRLIAYVASDAPASEMTRDLRTSLQSRLPEYMVPSRFVILTSLPLTANGKIDRKALPAPEDVRLELSAEYVTPSTETEMRLAAIWQDVLGVNPIGIEDNFFELGGHSLDVVQVSCRIEQTYQIRLPLLLLFENPTLVAFAQAVDRTRERAGPDATPATAEPAGAGPAASTSRIPLNSIDDAFVSFNAVLPGWSLMIHEYATPQEIDENKLKDAIAYALNLHPMARATIEPKNVFARRLYWTIPDTVQDVPLRTIECRNDLHLEQTRNQLRTTHKIWKGNPNFQFVLCKHPNDTRLILCTNHAATDRTGVNRFLISTLNHYLGLPDEPRRVAPFFYEELIDAWNTSYEGELSGSFKARHFRIADPLAHDARPMRKGIGHAALDLSETDTERLNTVSKEHGTSVNRILELAMVDAAKRWNEEHGKRVRCIRVTATMNMRPPGLYHEVVGNVVFTPVTIYHGSEDYSAWIHRQLSPANDSIETGLRLFQFAEHNNRTNKLPMPLKRFFDFLRFGCRVIPTLLVTNIQFTETDTLARLFNAIQLGEMDTVQFRSFPYFAPYVVVTRLNNRYRVSIDHSLRHLDQAASQRFIETLPRSIRSLGK